MDHNPQFPRRQAVPMTSNLRCLVVVVDDYPELAESMVAMLEDMGHHAIALTDPRDVLEVVGQHQPHVALIDLDMPVINGWDVAAQIRRRYAHLDLTLVSVSALPAAEAEEKSRRAAFDAHLAKPIDASLLERVLGEVSPCVARLS